MPTLSTYFTHQRALYGAAFLRIGYGIVAVVYYCRNYFDRRFLWGPDAVYPFDSFSKGLHRPGFSIYEIAESPVVFEFVFHVGLLVAVLFLVGFGGRVINVLHYVFVFSLSMRNPILLDGGDNFAYIALFFLMPVNTTAVLAVRKTPPRSETPTFLTFLHNLGLSCIIVQLCIVYLTSALNKVQGELWQNGTAIYYILNVPEFSWPVLTDRIVQPAWLVVAITYGTVFFQLIFPALILRPDTRIFAVILGIIFHLGIALTMGLTSFSLYMIASEAIVLSDSHYRRLAKRINNTKEMSKSILSNSVSQDIPETDIRVRKS